MALLSLQRFRVDGVPHTVAHQVDADGGDADDGDDAGHHVVVPVRFALRFNSLLDGQQYFQYYSTLAAETSRPAQSRINRGGQII